MLVSFLVDGRIIRRVPSVVVLLRKTQLGAIRNQRESKYHRLDRFRITGTLYRLLCSRRLE